MKLLSDLGKNRTPAALIFFNRLYIFSRKLNVLCCQSVFGIMIASSIGVNPLMLVIHFI